MRRLVAFWGHKDPKNKIDLDGNYSPNRSAHNPVTCSKTR
jgi:hypothetical protein